MKREFEEYFPLPWSVKCRQACYDMDFREEFVMLDMNAVEGQDGKRPPSLIDFTARGSYDHLNGRDPILEARKDALKYLVQCANLMPEAARLLRSADEKLLDLCRTCVNAMTEAGYFVDCKNCNVENLDTSIRALLAKLEGGEDDA